MISIQPVQNKVNWVSSVHRINHKYKIIKFNIAGRRSMTVVLHFTLIKLKCIPHT
jgi:hypothetical protein